MVGRRCVLPWFWRVDLVTGRGCWAHHGSSQKRAASWSAPSSSPRFFKAQRRGRSKKATMALVSRPFPQVCAFSPIPCSQRSPFLAGWREAWVPGPVWVLKSMVRILTGHLLFVFQPTRTSSESIYSRPGSSIPGSPGHTIYVSITSKRDILGAGEFEDWNSRIESPRKEADP